MTKIRVGEGHVSGHDVYHSEEFKAFCTRFGVAWDLNTTKLTIELTEAEMLVTQTYRPDPHQTHVDTTSLHNRYFRTGVPCPPASGPKDDI